MTDIATEERHLARPGATLAWSEAGSGPAVVWAHGVMSERFTLDRLGIADLQAVAEAGHRLIRYDARGHGRSTGAANPADYTWPHLAQDLITLADHVEPDRPLAAMGASMGAATVLHAALQAPERFDRFVLVIPPTAWETRIAQGAFYEQAADRIEALGPPAVDEMTSRMQTPAILAGLPQFPVEVGLDLLPSVMRGAGRSNLPSPDLLQAIAQPVLILAWPDDPVHPVTTAEQLAKVLPGAELQVADSIETVRRWPQMMVDFLKR